jgi:hypothetical protein
MTSLSEPAAIVAALAKCDPVDQDGDCTLCYERDFHAVPCPWLRARQWVEAMTRED